MALMHTLVSSTLLRRSLASALLLGLGGGGTAQAFCGTYVGSAGANLTNARSQVVIARTGDRTVLTMANDVGGEVSDFAMLVPVPEVLTEDDVDLVPKEALQRIDTYTAPRLVTYSCQSYYGYWYGDYYWYEDDGRRGLFSCRGCGGFGDKAESADYGYAMGGAYDTAGPSWADSIDVEEEFAVGEYEIVVLSADDAESLMAWAADQGYAIDEDAEALLSSYIEAGTYFFAAKVSLEALPEDQPWLSPLQFAYDSSVLTLPIRLGALNAEGDQDLVVTVINDQSEGAAHISSLPEREKLDECMWAEEGGETFADLYTDQLDTSFASGTEADGDGGWILEYAWGGGSCDPCPDPGFLADSDLSVFGWERGANSAFVSRLRVRYSADQADEDLVFYQSNLTTQLQTRFMTYDKDLEETFPICGEGWVTDDPGSCYDEDGALKAREARAREDLRRQALVPTGLGLVAFLGVLGLRRRRT